MQSELEKRIQAKEKVPSYLYQNVWRSILPSLLNNDQVSFLCIGTNRCTGDTFGPLVGTYLKERGYTNVYGTLHDPVHHLNLEETVEQIPSSTTIIAIDAALGKMNHVGYMFLEQGPVQPGKGVGKEIKPVGDYHIKGIVNLYSGPLNQMLLMSTQLDRVMDMAKQTAFILGCIFPRHQRTTYMKKTGAS